LGLGGTFYVCDFDSFKTRKDWYLTYRQMIEMDADGLEIGNHPLLDLRSSGWGCWISWWATTPTAPQALAELLKRDGGSTGVQGSQQGPQTYRILTDCSDQAIQIRWIHHDSTIASKR
jgi:hypothetical protein